MKIYGAVREKHVFFLYYLLLQWWGGHTATLYHTQQSDSVKPAVIYRRQDPEGGLNPRRQNFMSDSQRQKWTIEPALDISHPEARENIVLKKENKIK